jgi:hypothetical protein
VPRRLELRLTGRPVATRAAVRRTADLSGLAGTTLGGSQSSEAISRVARVLLSGTPSTTADLVVQHDQVSQTCGRDEGGGVDQPTGAIPVFVYQALTFTHLDFQTPQPAMILSRSTWEDPMRRPGSLHSVARDSVRLRPVSVPLPRHTPLGYVVDLHSH